MGKDHLNSRIGCLMKEWVLQVIIAKALIGLTVSEMGLGEGLNVMKRKRMILA